MDALTRRVGVEPGNPEAYYTMAAYYWEKAYRDTAVSARRRSATTSAGASRPPIRRSRLKPDYLEALTYKNLLLRSQALLDSDPEAQKRLIAEADALRNRAIEIQEARHSRSTRAGSRRTDDVHSGRVEELPRWEVCRGTAAARVVDEAVPPTIRT